jgi:prepilin-type processing-associated H-X9-DG protein/prepilin-type N-terminal cleavage/methylation domain-containing protein
MATMGIRGPNSTSGRITQERSHAFTLVELLVVMAVVVLLVTLLLPALTTAKAGARSAHCKSNLRQIGLALQLYLGDHHSYPPLGSSEAVALSPEAETETLEVFVALNGLLRCGGIYCPERELMTVNVIPIRSLGKGPQTAVFRGSYGYNAFGTAATQPELRLGLGGLWSTPQWRWEVVRESSVEVPAEMICFGDARPDAYVIQPGLNPQDFRGRGLSMRHSRGANILFCDGHVEYGKERCWVDKTPPVRRQWNVDHQPHEETWE